MVEEMNDTRNFWDLSKEELDQVMCVFFMRAKKIDKKSIESSGNDLYQPDTLNSYQNSWQRVITDKKLKFDIKKDPAFERSRAVLKSRRKELTKMGMGNKPNATRSLEREKRWRNSTRPNILGRIQDRI